MLRLSHPQRTQYHPLAGTWEDGQGNSTLGSPAFQAAGAALGTAGLSALDCLLAFRTHLTLEDAFANLKNLNAGDFHSPS
jgi:hypothetical protein